MSKGTKLIIAGILFLLYGAFAIYSGILPGSARHNEDHLQSAAESLIADEGLAGVRVEMDGQLAILSGTVPSEEARREAIHLVRSADWSGGVIAGGVTVVRADDLTVSAPSPPAPFVWTAQLSSRQLILSGVVPDEISRAELLARAREKYSPVLRSESIEIIDRMTVATGAPVGNWLGAATASLDGLAMLETGKATGNGLVFNVTGRASSQQKKTAAEQRIETIPDGYKATTKIDLAPVPSPYVWNAAMSDRTSPVVLTGYIPNEATRKQIVDHAKVKFPQGVIDNLQISRGMPDEDWPGNILKSIDALAMLDSGSISGRDRQIIVRGQTNDLGTAGKLDGFAGSMSGSGYNASLDLTVPDAPKIEDVDQCQALFDDAMSQTSIRFRNASAEILPTSEPVLNKLALVARQCAGFKITISGHTDSVGGATLNQKLSEARAQSVVNWLSARGAKGSQLSARGFGETKPIADNSTPDGRARNRRIDFSIQQ